VEADLDVASVERGLDGQLLAVFIGEVVEFAGVPHDHGARAVFAFGDGSLELGVLQRVVLGTRGQPLLAWVEGRALRHRPRGRHLTDLQPEVEMEGRSIMTLYDEYPAPAPILRGSSVPAWLSGGTQAALRAVAGQSIHAESHVLGVPEAATGKRRWLQFRGCMVLSPRGYLPLQDS